MNASVPTNIHSLHIAKAMASKPNFGDAKNTPQTPFAPMIKLEQAPDHYRISVVMPPVACKSNWVSWDREKLRLKIPAINYKNSPISRPGFIRWLSLPADAAKSDLPNVMYTQGSLVIIVPRKRW